MCVVIIPNTIVVHSVANYWPAEVSQHNRLRETLWYEVARIEKSSFETTRLAHFHLPIDRNVSRNINECNGHL